MDTGGDSLIQRSLHRLAPLSAPAVVLGLWQLIVGTGYLPTNLLPGPGRVLTVFLDVAFGRSGEAGLYSGTLLTHTLASLWRVYAGFLVGIGLGIFLGSAGAVALTKSLSALLFHVSPRDPGVLFGVAALLATCAMLSCAIPAFRTARIDPASVLRDE